ncbi:tenascin [Apostichopus japonicus]|uniref:Tenascin n=1 Tax=Stichopus japonicus TaxID=307972 RepID=A0A2G8KV82_STIJA|nr:tenascin [Apostichopus japonicus]
MNHSKFTAKMVGCCFRSEVGGSVSFYETWNNYRDGFGDLNSSFWLGNEKLHVISAQRDHQLRIDIWFNNTNDDSSYLHYNLFRVSSEATQYEITLGSYTGSYEYDYMDYHRDMKFSTYDQDNDLANQNCASTSYHPGGWWFNACHAIMLNGIYGNPWDTGICLFQRITRDKNCSVVAVDMKMKPL